MAHVLTNDGPFTVGSCQHWHRGALQEKTPIPKGNCQLNAPQNGWRNEPAAVVHRIFRKAGRARVELQRHGYAGGLGVHGELLYDATEGLRQLVTYFHWQTRGVVSYRGAGARMSGCLPKYESRERERERDWGEVLEGGATERRRCGGHTYRYRQTRPEPCAVMRPGRNRATVRAVYVVLHRHRI